MEHVDIHKEPKHIVGGDVELRLTCAQQVNFASQQNAIALLRDIELFNHGDTLHQLTLELSASPAFLQTKRWQIEQLPAQQLLHLNDRELTLESAYLFGLNESLQGSLQLRLYDEHGVVLAEQSQSIEVLAHNEWGGYASNPELLAAFCQPNQPVIDQLLRQTSELLRQNGQEGTLLSAEKATPERLWQQLSALWSTLLSQQLDYAYPPSSFEQQGQKIRSPERMLEARRATCVETSLLLAALLEQMQLNPLIIIEQGHAYVGVWLSNEGFAHPWTDDLLSLRKRVQLQEILVLESTLLCQQASFRQALHHAQQCLDSGDERFIGVLDIVRAREARIRPLPTLNAVADGEVDAVEHTALDLSPALHTPSPNWQSTPATPQGRLEQWQRRLLDLSLRNPLLNLRRNRTTLRLIAPEPGLLEDRLAQGKALSIESAPEYPERDRQLHTQQTGADLERELALSALERNRLYASCEASQLDSALVELYRKARNDLEEGGANTLYLAIGTLYWQRPEQPERSHRAPLILIPVSITRPSVRSGIRLTLCDDEPRCNTTLLEMLRQDFELDIPGLDGPLPQDEHGTDIHGILTHLRQAIRDVPGFEIRDEVHLGTFSFAKYLMWKDLVDRTDQLRRNPVVAQLLDGEPTPTLTASGFIAPEQLDHTVSPATLYTPLPADSSQLAAVVAASNGQPFVMIGPPGTGKSQTIANMIAHNLGLGRTVLFVSEKAAALDVVYRRLREQGLGAFCLELHSNKARKLDVIRQLGEAWEAQSDDCAERWSASTDALGTLRQQLNELVDLLHQPHRHGLSIRQALALSASQRQVPDLKLHWPSADTHDQGSYQQLLELGERLHRQADSLGDLHRYPLTLLRHTEWSTRWQQELLDQAQRLGESAQAWQQGLLHWEAQLALPNRPHHHAYQQAVETLARALLECHGQTLDFLFQPHPQNVLQALPQAADTIERFQQTLASLSCPYDRQALLNGALTPARTLWQSARQGSWLGKTWRAYQTRRYLQKQLGAQGTPDPERDLTTLQQLQALELELQRLEPVLQSVTGWYQLDSDPARLRSQARAGQALHQALAQWAENAEQLHTLRAALQPWVVDGNELLAPQASYGQQLHQLLGLRAQLVRQFDEFARLAGRTPLALQQALPTLPELLPLATELQTHQHRLNSWCSWQRVQQEAEQAGLQPLIDALYDGTLPSHAARDAIEVNHARWWVSLMIDATPALRQFVAAEHQHRIKRFRVLDAEVRQLTSACIRQRIRGDLSPREAVTRQSELGIIRRELEKKTRHKPLRQLISEAPNAITQLTPCLLMSPLSIAQYLPLEQRPFDLVIFDEASQITVWDAIGAISRGQQTIVVGDPKQLPPTSFFTSAQSAVDEESDDEEDLESILDELLASNLPVRPLAWHYRSRHESLISFSNQRYYDGKLVTFPSPVTRDTAVHREYVEGRYERGGSQTNPAEAEAIVREIEARVSDSPHPALTLGVVTFNQKQQTLILDLLDQARRRNSELDRWFAEDLIEPIFVKNLESVQGDERDVILFSTTFGPDLSGKISMNFGPLNKSGGERRLNVAITRARVELKVFTSLQAEQIDLSRTASEGVRDLKHFLEFAEKGRPALGEALQPQSLPTDPLLERLSEELNTLGWQVDTHIGVSRLGVDLAIVDPARPGHYLAGLLCDGDRYREAATARDRELVRPDILHQLGWQLLFLWSTDYWIDPQGSLERLHQQLLALQTATLSQQERAAPLAEESEEVDTETPLFEKSEDERG